MGTLVTAMMAGCREKIPERYQPFFDLSYRVRRDSLLGYPIEEQLNLYRIGMRVIRPPPLYLADDVAANGPTAIPPILARLRKVQDDSDRSDLILVLRSMVCLEGVDLRKQPGTIDAIKEAIAVMRLGLYRQRAEEDLTTITDGCVTQEAHAREKYDLLRHADSSRR